MSAFIVSKSHIDAIVAAALTYEPYGVFWRSGDIDKALRSITWDDVRTNDQPVSPSELGQMLWHENVVSVAHRYPDDAPSEWPGPIGLGIDTVLAYRYQRPKRLPSVIEAIKLIHCLEHQSCEHDEWEQSEAYTVLNIIKDNLIWSLPGYEQANWTFEG